MALSLGTPVCDLLGIDVPIMQAPVGSATCPALAAAVSKSGGMGTLALTWTEVDAVTEAIRATRSLTGNPFAVNLVLEWDPRERIEVCAQERVPLISTSWGDPSTCAGAIHDAGALHIHTVGSVAEAVAAVAAGVDVIVAQGVEAGGHVAGTTSGRTLVPAVVGAVSPVPVLAAGGIADARGVVAALSLGAQGVWMGTRFLAAHEANIHPVYRRRLIDAGDGDTVYTRAFDGGWPGAPHRVLRNATVTAWEAAGRPPAPGRPGEGDVVGTAPNGRAVPRYHMAMPQSGTDGDVEEMALYAGQGVGLVRTCEPAADIVRVLCEGTRRLLL